MDPENMNNLRWARAPIAANLVAAPRTGKLRPARFYPILLCLALAFWTPALSAASVTAAERSAAGAALADIDRGQWDAAHDAARQAHFPLLEKLVEWLDLTRPAGSAEFSRFTRFIDQNPDWPSLTLLKKHAEEAIADSTPPGDVVAWFQRFPPIGPTGAARYIDALNAVGQSKQAEATARQFLVDGAMQAGQVIEFAGRYASLLRQVDYELRVDRLIWAGDTEGPLQLLPYLSPGARAVAQARIAFATQSASAPAMLSNLSIEQQTDLGLLYERMRWLRRQDRDNEAIALLDIAPPTLPHAELWWNERAILARRALESGDPKTAYQLARDHRQASGSALADGEWLSGWIALRFLNDPQGALTHFEIMKKTVATPISVSRAFYWAGRAEEALGDRRQAEQDYAHAATFIGAYYGQIALAKINPAARLVLPPQPTVASLDSRMFGNRELVQVVELLQAIGLADRADAFVRRIGEIARTPEEALLAIRLAKANNSLAAAVQVSKKLMQGGMPVLADGYPVIAPLGPKAPEPALIHAIIRQESLFDAGAISPSGALGLMQLMPATARTVAGKMRVRKFNTGLLTADPQFNVTLGSNYLADLVDHFNGSYVMAIGGYNAGPGRVAGWLRDNGDPRPRLEDTIDWIEKIGVTETRNYVQRVMENLGVYRARLAGGSAPNENAKDLTR
jgi:soluble lytic murein transglycosylase